MLTSINHELGPDLQFPLKIPYGPMLQINNSRPATASVDICIFSPPGSLLLKLGSTPSYIFCNTSVPTCSFSFTSGMPWRVTQLREFSLQHTPRLPSYWYISQAYTLLTWGAHVTFPFIQIHSPVNKWLFYWFLPPISTASWIHSHRTFSMKFKFNLHRQETLINPSFRNTEHSCGGFPFLEIT